MRLAIMLGVAPALALSPLNIEAILIHYDGSDVHAHAVTVGEIDSWVERPAHESGPHEHDGQAGDPHAHDGGDLLLVLDLPDTDLRLYTPQAGAIVAAFSAAEQLPAVASATIVADDTPQHARSWLCAPALRPHRTVAGILQTNHALLL